jgi:hypothetical protein
VSRLRVARMLGHDSRLVRRNGVVGGFVVGFVGAGEVNVEVRSGFTFSLV